MPTFPDKLEGETLRAYAAFTMYAGLGSGRNLASVGQTLGKSTTLMERWSAAHA